MSSMEYNELLLFCLVIGQNLQVILAYFIFMCDGPPSFPWTSYFSLASGNVLINYFGNEYGIAYYIL